MKIFIAGVDGYLGWALAQHLVTRNHEIAGMDNYMRRDWVAEMGSQSATPISKMTERLEAFREHHGENLQFQRFDLTDYDLVLNALQHFKPDCIVHLAEVASAPYSMKGYTEASYTLKNNFITTFNIIQASKETKIFPHIVKLGTMGEYGTPNIDIEEGFIDINHKNRGQRFLFCYCLS